MKTELVDAFYPSYSIVKERAVLPCIAEAALPKLEVPDNRVELIGVEPTTSSLQSWRSTN